MSEVTNVFRFPVGIADFTSASSTVSGTTTYWKPQQNTHILLDECMVIPTTAVTGTSDIVLGFYLHNGTVEVEVGTCTVSSGAAVGTCFYFVPATGYGTQTILGSTDKVRVAVDTVGTAGAAEIDLRFK